MYEQRLQEVRVLSMKRTLTALTVAATMSASSASAYDPEDLQKLLTTGDCISCDLSDLYFENFIALELINIREANLYEANLSGADLADQDLSGIFLQRANLAGADLSSTILTGANLSDTELTGANLTGANLRDADLIGAVMNGAILCNTIMPNRVYTVLYSGC